MRWTAQLQTTKSELRLLITSPESGDVLKARLPLGPAHPRALLTLLEGIALWSGSALSVAISAERDFPGFHDSGLFGDELWPGESLLVQYEVGGRGRPKRLRGLGDFRRLRVRWLRGGGC
jgi:hypothetical protein